MSSIMDLPAEIVADILSRDSVKTIAQASCVCKRWHSILSDHYFVDLHLSRSPAWLIIHQQSDQGKDDVFNVDQLDDRSDQHDIHLDIVTKFAVGLDIKYPYSLEGSVNGLLCVWQLFEIYICNPITRENIILPKHDYHMYFCEFGAKITIGFGFVKSTNQYKVVYFYQCNQWCSPPEGLNKEGCLVYTLGTGIWRNLAPVPFLPNDFWRGIFFNGKLHWLAHNGEDNSNNEMVCAFDLEKELFQQIASAPRVDRNFYCRRLGLLRGCLCVCDNTPTSELAIWVMKDYGRKESWIKEIVIQNQPHDLVYTMIHPLKVLRDGTILMECYERFLFTYHPVHKTMKIYYEGDTLGYDAMVYSPSFIRLKNYMFEKVLVL